MKHRLAKVNHLAVVIDPYDSPTPQGMPTNRSTADLVEVIRKDSSFHHISTRTLKLTANISVVVKWLSLIHLTTLTDNEYV